MALVWNLRHSARSTPSFYPIFYRDVSDVWFLVDHNQVSLKHHAHGNSDPIGAINIRAGHP